MLEKLLAKIRKRPNHTETPDPTPIAVPVHYKKPPTLQEQMQRMMGIISRDAAAQGLETFEEAEDFDVGEDYDPSSPYELEFDPLLGKEVYKQERAHMDASRKKFDAFVEQKIKERRENPPPPKKKKEKVKSDEEPTEE